MSNNYDFYNLNLEDDPDMKMIMDNQYNSDELELSQGSLSQDDLEDSDDSDDSLVEFENVDLEDTLVIKSQIRNMEIKFLVDCSAKNTIMSKSDAEKLKLLENINKPQYLTKLSNVKVKIEDELFFFDIIVINDDSKTTTLGLDNLKRYKAIINIEGNYLRIGCQSIMFCDNESLKSIDKSENFFKLFEFGFEKEKIIDALKHTNNNFDKSLNLLTQS